MDESSHIYNPTRVNLFTSLDLCSFRDTRVMLCGQDPYPDPSLCTGLAFSIPRDQPLPVTLKSIFKEYCSDLHLPMPKHGDLTAWANQGVLLWNVIPSCESHKSLSHNWPEWACLTQEIIKNLRQKGVVFCFLGGMAGQYEKFIKPIHDYPNCAVVKTSHPSPRGSTNSKHPFAGSRLFSTINAHLNRLGLETIDWRL